VRGSRGKKEGREKEEKGKFAGISK